MVPFWVPEILGAYYTKDPKRDRNFDNRMMLDERAAVTAAHLPVLPLHESSALRCSSLLSQPELDGQQWDHCSLGVVPAT